MVTSSTTTKRFGRAVQPKPQPTNKDRLLAYEDLQSKGIRYSRNWLRDLAKHGHFPKPVMLSARRAAWYERDIDAWLASKAEAAR
jgi:predicted DNA-binding transcriptional regulator AlpA